MEGVEHIRIRPISRDDLDEVIAINIECLPEHYPYSFWLEHMDKWGDVFYVAEVNGNIVGYLLSRVEDGPIVCRGGSGRIGHIVSLAVREKYRGRGIATALIVATLIALKTIYNVEEVHLEVRVSNYKAIRLYEKLGFVKVARNRGYYLDGEDSYLMVKNLSSEPCKAKPIE